MMETSGWVAVASGALDVREHPLSGDVYRYLIAPAVPGMPVMLRDDGAALWSRLVEEGPLLPQQLDDEQRDMVEEMADMGIAGWGEDHPARITAVPAPWLTSPVHELVYAILGRVADERGIEIVFIKGPTLHAQGLREREHSGDVDCWVEPGSEVRFARAMQDWGWRPAFSAFTGTPVLHSLTLRAPEWGCAVDVHSWFPGMTVPHEEAFARVKNASQPRTFAGYRARTPDRGMHAVISALHDVRPVSGHPAGEYMVSRAAATLELAGVEAAEAAVQTGSEYALAEPLMRVFPEYPIDVEHALVPTDWAWRLQSNVLRTYAAALRTLPWRARLRAMFRVLWPTEESLRAGPVAQASGLKTVSALRMRRFARGLSEVSATIRGR